MADNEIKKDLNFLIVDDHIINLTLLGKILKRNGYKSICTAKNNDTKYQHIPFLMVTGEAEKEQVLHAVEEGVDGYQIKPYSEERIINNIKQILHAKSLSDST